MLVKKNDSLELIMKEIKQTGYLNQRYTKIHTTSREYGYYLNLEGMECSDIEFRYCKGRLMGDVFEKLGLLEDLLEKIPPRQFIQLIESAARYSK